MRANELMIGDWVICHHPTCEPKQAQVTVGLLHCLEQQDLGFQTEESPLFRIVEPIPLTAEILERNGFGKVLDEYGMECYRYFNNAGDGYIKISLYDGGACDWIVEIVNYDKFNDNEIDYNNSFVFLKVHELQHALKLCEINKDIEL